MDVIPQKSLIHDTDLAGYWLVTGFGGIELGPVSSRNDFYIDVEFHELEPPSNTQAPKNDHFDLAITGRSKIIQRPLSTSLLLTYGTILKDNQYVGRRSTYLSPLTQTRISFDTNKHIKGVISRTEKDSKGEYLINTVRNRKSNAPNLGRFIFIDTHGIELIVPCFEIFKSYYLWSRGLTQSLLSNHIYEPEKYIYDGSKSSFDPHSHFAEVQLRSHLRNSDAKAVIRFFLGKHSGHIKKMLQKSFSHYLTDTKNSLTNLVSYPAANGEETWQIEYYQLPSQKKRLFVSKILSCSSDWGVDTYIYKRDNPGKKATGEKVEGLTKPGSKFNPESKNTLPAHNKGKKERGTIPEINTQAPDPKQTTYMVFPESACLHVNSPHGIEDTYPAYKKGKTFNTHGKQTTESTSTGSAIRSGAANKNTATLDPRNNITDASQKNDAHSKGLIPVSYHANLFILAFRHPEIMSIKYVTVSAPYLRENERIYNTLPVGQSKSAWCYSDKEKTKPLLVQIIEIILNDQFIYYYEFQQRFNRPIGYIIAYQTLFHQFEIKEHLPILNSFVKNRMSKAFTNELDSKLSVRLKKHSHLDFARRTDNWIKLFESLSLNTSGLKSSKDILKETHTKSK